MNKAVTNGKKGFANQLTRQVGEHLVASKLGRMGYVAAPFAGNVPLFDLLAADRGGNSVPIQVKAINSGTWQYRADSLLEIEHVGKVQRYRGNRALLNPQLICVYVFLQENGADEFYIFRLRDLQKITLTNYFWGRKTRTRPRNAKSTHAAVSPKDLARFRDNWKLIVDTFRSF